MAAAPQAWRPAPLPSRSQSAWPRFGHTVRVAGEYSLPR
jgi:hypothetical protein